MRFHRKVTRDGKTLLTISLWGDGFKNKDLKKLLEDMLEELVVKEE